MFNTWIAKIWYWIHPEERKEEIDAGALLPFFASLACLNPFSSSECPNSDLNPNLHQVEKDFPGGSDGNASAYNAGDPGSTPGSGRSPGEGNGNPLQYSCLGNPMDGGAWWATVYGVTESRTWLSNFTFTRCSRYCRYHAPYLPDPPEFTLGTVGSKLKASHL